MKISTKFSDRMKALALAMFLSGSVATMQAAVHYVRMAADATSWSGIAGADIISSDTPEIIATDTYYFAKGTYTLIALGIDPLTGGPASITPAITTGAIFGGFSGTETTIDLAARALSDKDGNGIVEPWEFTNETILKGNVPYADGEGSALRLVTVTGGEINGLTLADHYYFGQIKPTQIAYSGAIILGAVSSTPAVGDNVPEKAGKMLYCTVRKLRAGANGPVMVTNSKSIIDKCLFEECKSDGLVSNGGGGAIWMNSFGGTVSNSVLRNNIAFSGVSNSSGRGGAIYSSFNSTNTFANLGIIFNCAIYNNESGYSGGAIRIEGKDKSGLLGGQIINCSVVNNKTTGTGTASVELIFDGQLMVNTIVVGDAKDEIRPQANNNHIASCVYGTKNGSIVMKPEDAAMASGKVTADLKFKKATNYCGIMNSEESDPFNQAVYDSIRTTNLTIVDASSPAVTTTGLTTMPAAFTSNPAIVPTATIPATDLAGVARTGAVTIGAYQFTGSSAVNAPKAENVTAYAVAGGILVSSKAGKIASVYSVAGKLISKEVLKADVQVINVAKGFYIVSVGSAKVKVLVK